jgi:hypothetical protein
MGNDHNPRITTPQGFAIPSTPLDVAVMGLKNLLLLLSLLNHACRSFNDSIHYL